MSNGEGNATRSGGIGFFGLLTILFIGLKLTGFIDWEWWLVLSPLLVGFVLWLLAVVLVVIAALCSKQDKWR